MKHSSSHGFPHCWEIHRPLLGSVSYTLINILKKLNSNRINCAHSHNLIAYSRVFLPIIPLHYNPCSALTIINTEKIIPVKEAIRSTLQGLNPDEQLSKLIDFFQVATERDVQLSELIAEAWDYLDVN